MSLERDPSITKHSPSTCLCCNKDFLVPTSVLEILDEEKSLLEMECQNCDTVVVASMTEQQLLELDREMDTQAELINNSVQMIDIVNEMERIDDFARALQDGHVLPEDF